MNPPSPGMGLKGRQFANSYAKVGLETEVMSASPQKLIDMLLSGARASIAKARIHMQSSDVPARGEAISKAIDIISAGLRAAVDESVGDVAKSLITTYDLATHHLLLANARSDMKHLDIADSMLADVQTAWREATNS